jgi:hypothetical protein
MVAIQVRDVPDAVRDALAAEADSRGQSLQVFLSEVLEREARLARNRAWLKRTRDNPIARIAADESSADLIRRQREERTQQILDAVSGSTA